MVENVIENNLEEMPRAVLEMYARKYLKLKRQWNKASHKYQEKKRREQQEAEE